MKKLLGRVAAAVCFCMSFTAAGYGKQMKEVYLKDGGVIECRSFWKEDGKVMVLVNRELLVDVPRNEVDLKRTFKARKRAAARKAAPVARAAADTGQVNGAVKGKATPPPVAAAPQKGTASPTPPVATPGAKVVPPGPKGAQ